MLEASEGISIVPTSRTYDQGRDGRSIGSSRGSHRVILCATLNKDLDSKITSDVLRLVQTGTTPEHLFYCTSCPVTEHQIDQMTADIRSLTGWASSISILGSEQIASLAEKNASTFRDLYHEEVRSIEETLRAFESKSAKAETVGLRLALLAFGSEDVRNLRREISTRAILDVLAQKSACRPEDVAEVLSRDLKLPRPLNRSFVEMILQEAALQGITQSVDSCWVMTDKGRELASAIPPEAASELARGRNVIKESLESLIGISFTSAQFEQIWATLLDFLSELFYSKGLAVITAIERFISDSDGGVVDQNWEKMITEGADRVSRLVATSELASRLRRAVHDIFVEREGPAFDWLSRVCERFVALCALGLESESSEELRQVISKHKLILDTDIVLTVLCASEPDHAAARDVLSRWRQIGGQIMLSTPVMQEVAYHAWIATREFAASSHLLGKLKGNDLQRYVGNVFVRAFHKLVAEGQAKPSQWGMFISQYKGEKPHDYGPVFRNLQRALSAERVPELIDEGFKSRIVGFLQGITARSQKKSSPAELSKEDLGKIDTDGTIMSNIAAARENLRLQSSDRSLVLLSSSVRLKRVDEQFRSNFGSPSVVLGPGELSYLLALVPDVNLGLGTLRRALFEFGKSASLPDAGRLALRVIKATGVYDIAWGERDALQQHLDQVLRSEARKRGTDLTGLKKRFEEGDPSIQPAQIILDTLESMAITHQEKQELMIAKRRIRELESELSETKARTRRTGK